ncbi:beta-ketoacyl-ACP synthase III [Inquilinus sp. Marseille-Q2685]|uniref:beta-ketoacyl-ACP synthase III n=1 Tax=Inquilinus sp. Marseille-Q2685 TaxID=2866581 RepID=UPI001CE49FD2|nr:beta-ketoacyl-ACP synthase III [Inquilinus sp. Marseille-Q2685]
MTVRRARIIGCGSALPDRVVTNADLARTVDTSDEWIVQRTGISVRHIAAPDEKTSDLALAAARKALAMAKVEGSDLDLVVLATTTPDQTFPATAVRVQAALGMTRGAAFDVQAVCSGFVYALSIADNMIRLGQARTALVIGAETFSRLLDWNDRSTCVLFGDGAGAVVLRAVEGGGTTDDPGILSTHLHSDGRHEDKLFVDGGPSSTGTVGHVRMEGREVFKHAVINLAEVVEEALAANGLSPSDIDWLVPHQANKRIIDATARKLDLPPEKVVLTVQKHANTSAASIPLALAEAVSDGRIKPGDLVLLEAMGGGLTWGAALVRW